jgi:peptide/nickel transport system substrate-binding protein
MLASCYNEKKSGKHFFRYNETQGIASLDPAFAKNQSIMWAVHQVYNTLVEVDEHLNIRPSLAKHWDISADRKTFTFHLRDDVFFHDDAIFPNGRGRKLSANDVVYSFSRIIDKTVASPGAWIFNRKVDTLQPFLAIDDTTFQMKLLQPYHPILGILSMQYCSVIPSEAVQHYGNDFRKHPVGSGPFRFIAWEEGQALVLAKNENYFEKDSTGHHLPYLDGIKISFFDSKATEFLLFRQKKLDFINDIEASFKDEVLSKTGGLRKEWEGKIILNTHPYLNTEYLGILMDSSNALLKNSPLRAKKLRQAINFAIDRRKMILYLRNSLGTPAESGFVPAGLPSFSEQEVSGYHYDPQRSAELLKEAGFPGGKGIEQIKLYTIPNYAEMGNFIARQLNEVGIPVQVEVVQKSLLLEMTSNSRALFFRGSWIADYPDAENYLSVFYSKNPAPPNYTRYKNPEYDRLFERALEETNDSLRYLLYQQADKLIVNDAVVIPLWYDKAVHLLQSDLTGFHPNALNMLELRYARFR